MKDTEFDDLLRKRYEDHSAGPREDLWEGIDSRLQQKKTDQNLRKVRRLKFAISSVAALLAGLIVYSVVNTRENKTDLPVISKAPANRVTIEIKKGIPLELNSGIRTIDVNSAVANKITEEKPGQRSDQKGPVSSDKSLPLLAHGKNPVEGILIEDGMQACSAQIIGHASSLYSLLTRSAWKNYAGVEATAENAVNGVPEALNQAELILPETGGRPGQTGTPAQSGKGLSHTTFFIEGDVSPEISYRALLINSRYSLPDYGKPYFNKAERPDLTFSAGVSGGFAINDRLILKSGVFYSRYSYKFRTNAFNLIDTGSYGSLVYTSSGPVNIKLISSDSLTEESLIKSSINFSFVSVPLIAEFHFGNNYFLNLGLVLNMLVGQNMNWQAENYNGNFYEATTDPIEGLEFAGLSMIVGVGKEKYITRQLSVLINPSVRINLTSLNAAAPVKSYPYSLGLNAGLRYYFD